MDFFRITQISLLILALALMPITGFAGLIIYLPLCLLLEVVRQKTNTKSSIKSFIKDNSFDAKYKLENLGGSILFDTTARKALFVKGNSIRLVEFEKIESFDMIHMTKKGKDVGSKFIFNINDIDDPIIEFPLGFSNPNEWQQRIKLILGMV